MLELIDMGRSSREIADTLSISVHYRKSSSSGNIGQTSGEEFGRSLPFGQESVNYHQMNVSWRSPCCRKHP